MADASRTVEIQMTQDGPRPTIEVVVPYGTKLAETVKLHDFLSREIIGKLSPRGCDTCNSGVNIYIRERYNHVITVDLDNLTEIR